MQTFLQCKFLRAHNNATLGECVRYPLYICTVIEVMKYWNKILHMQEHRYVLNCYKLLHYLDSTSRQNWATDVKQVLHKMASVIFGNNRKLQIKMYF